MFGSNYATSNPNMQAFGSQLLAKNGAGIGFTDAAQGSGMAFLIGELEKRDMTIREPLSSVTWPRDITAVTGGGWVDYTSNMYVDYGTTGNNEFGLITNSTTQIPVMQADLGKDIFKVFTWANILRVPFIDQKKMDTIGRSIDDLLDRGIRLNYNKTIDQNVYLGLTPGTPGLLNNPEVTVSQAPATGTSGSTKWIDKTPDQVLAEFNAQFVAVWETSEYDMAGMPNHVLLPPDAFAALSIGKVSDAGNVSILDYIQTNNIATRNGVDVTIAPCRWCVNAGTGGTMDRAVFYRRDEDKISFDLTVALSRIATEASVIHMAFMTAYAAQIGQVKLNYLQTIKYYDGI